MPFPSTIDWEAVALHLSPSPASNATCSADDAGWLSGWLAARGRLEAMRRRGWKAFRDHLDYEQNVDGVADAVVVELAVKMAQRETHARHKAAMKAARGR